MKQRKIIVLTVFAVCILTSMPFLSTIQAEKISYEKNVEVEKIVKYTLDSPREMCDEAMGEAYRCLDEANDNKDKAKEYEEGSYWWTVYKIQAEVYLFAAVILFIVALPFCLISAPFNSDAQCSICAALNSQ